MTTQPRTDAIQPYHAEAVGPWSHQSPYALAENLGALTSTLLEHARSAKVADTFESAKPHPQRDYETIRDCAYTQRLARDAWRTITERLGGTWTDRDSLIMAAAEAHRAIDDRKAWADAQLG